MYFFPLLPEFVFLSVVLNTGLFQNSLKSCFFFILVPYYFTLSLQCKTPLTMRNFKIYFSHFLYLESSIEVKVRTDGKEITPTVQTVNCAFVFLFQVKTLWKNAESQNLLSILLSY